MVYKENSTYNSEKKWEALLRISEESHSASDIEQFVGFIHKTLANLVMARNFFIALYEEASDKYFFPYFKDQFDQIDTVGVEAGYDESLKTTLYDLTGTLTDHVRRTGSPVRFPNKAMASLLESGEIELFGSQSTSWLGVPLKHAGQTIGVMVIQVYGVVDAYSHGDEELMVFVSDHIARAIENVRAEEKMRKQHQLVLKQTQAITDSFTYANRIQKAVLPSPGYIRNILPEYFVIHRPKDIVSGDFYWVREIEGYPVIVVADCTGHGVPGALMSMLGVTLLNEQFRVFGIQEPGVILGHLRTRVKEILAPESGLDGQKDGMDMALVIIDPEKGKLKYAGANRPLYLVRSAELDLLDGIPHSITEQEGQILYEIKGDKQPIGIHWEESPFTSHCIPLCAGDSAYMFSDGFVDQYGGPGRKKFKAVNFRKLLLSVQDKSMPKQQLYIDQAFRQWRGSHEQIDDVCIFGMKI